MLVEKFSETFRLFISFFKVKNTFKKSYLKFYCINYNQKHHKII